jgi:hypothetical protein
MKKILVPINNNDIMNEVISKLPLDNDIQKSQSSEYNSILRELHEQE